VNLSGVIKRHPVTDKSLAEAEACRRPDLNTTLRETILPKERHQPMPYPLLIFRVAEQIFDKESLLIKEPPDQKRQRRPDRDQPPIRAECKRCAE
jgi:hypothetical protein